MRRLLLRFGLPGLVIGLLVYGYFQLEWIEEEKDLGLSAEARRNHFLAAERFLAKQGIRVDDREAEGVFLGLPPHDYALLYDNSLRSLGNEALDDLREWIQSGGHLVLIAYDDPQLEVSDYDEIAEAEYLVTEDVAPAADLKLWIRPWAVDPCYARIDAADESQTPEEGAVDTSGEPLATPAPAEAESAASSGSDAADEAASQAANDPGEGEDGGTVIRAKCFAGSARFAQEPEPLALQFTSTARLRADDERVTVLAFDDNGPVIAQTALGQGRVTWVVDFDWWKNDAIGSADHAHVLLALLRDRQGAWFVRLGYQPHWLELLGRYGQALLLSLAILIALLLWRSGVRFGPIVAQEEPIRRDLSEHLQAVGEFHWRGHDVSGLLAATRNLVQQRHHWQFKVPLTGPTEQWQREQETYLQAVSARSGVAIADVRHAMTAVPSSEQELLAVSRILQRLLHD